MDILYQQITGDFQREVIGDHEKVAYFGGSTVRIWKNQESASYQTHWHSAVEIVMPLINQYTVVIHNHRYILNVGDILVIPPGELHELIAPSSGERMIYLFDITHISKIKGFSSVLPFLTTPILLTRENAPDIYESARILLNNMSEAYSNSEVLWELSVYSYIISLFVLIGQSHIDGMMAPPNTATNQPKEYIEKFNLVFDYIDNHYMEELTLEKVAYLAGYSKYHFTRLFKQYSDTTFYDYLCHKRIRIAEELLINPSMNITEIALRSGFPSISTFNRMFKKTKKCTPTEYRKLHRWNSMM